MFTSFGNISAQSTKMSGSFFDVSLVSVAPAPILLLTISECTFDSLEAPDEWGVVFQISGNNSYITMNSISYTNSKNVNFLNYTSTNSELGQSELILFDIYVENINSLATFFLLFQQLNVNDYITIENTTMTEYTFSLIVFARS